MTTIHKEIFLDVRPEEVWAAVRDVGAVHVRLTPGVVVDTRLEDNSRIVTFGNGTVIREVIIDIDDEARRFAYAAVGGRTVHHNASMQVFAVDSEHSRLVWITDLLPNDLTASIRQLVEVGATTMKQTLEAASGRSAPTTQRVEHP